MNIFAIEGTQDYVDWRASARSQDNLRVNKMILESCQMLCTDLNILHGEPVTPYKSTHENHPSTQWARQSSANWLALAEHCEELLFEFERRMRKRHKCEVVFEVCVELFDSHIFPAHTETPLPLCMPDEFKGPDIVESYRRFYASKPNIRYPANKVPSWFLSYRTLPFVRC
jgi:hypothetical protein